VLAVNRWADRTVAPAGLLTWIVFGGLFVPRPSIETEIRPLSVITGSRSIVLASAARGVDGTRVPGT
jgi:hypothetical protein